MQNSVSIVVANLATTEKYFDHFECEMHTDNSGTHRVAVTTTTGTWNPATSRFEQNKLATFTNAINGTTYWFRFRVIDKYGNAGPWSTFISEVGGDSTAPSPTYGSVAVGLIAGGLYVKLNPAGAASDNDRYELFVRLNSGTTPVATDLPTYTSIDGNFDLGIKNGDSAHMWARAVDTSGNKQVWVSLGAFGPGTLDSLPDGPIYGKGGSNGKNICPNPGFELNVSGTVMGADQPVGGQVGDGWTVWSKTQPTLPAWFVNLESPSVSRSGGSNLRISLDQSVPIPASSPFYECRVVSSKIPCRTGDIIRIQGYTRWDTNIAIPAGLVILQRIGIIMFDDVDAFVGELYAEFNNSPVGAYRLQEASVEVTTSTLSYVRVQCAGFVQNPTGSPISTPAGQCADLRFDDLMMVFQNTAFDLTPINTSGHSTSAVGALSQVGVTTTINIAASTIQFGDGLVGYNSGSVNPGALGTFFVYADDPTYSGGAVTYAWTATESVLYATNGRIYFGTITTTGGGSTFSLNPPGTGGGRTRLTF